VHGGDGGTAFWTFAVTVGIDGFAHAFASVVLITYMSTLASADHAASQFEPACFATFVISAMSRVS
jgi:PAT family beta-lactamase induction signal transducer AmpG